MPKASSMRHLQVNSNNLSKGLCLKNNQDCFSITKTRKETEDLHNYDWKWIRTFETKPEAGSINKHLWAMTVQVAAQRAVSSTARGFIHPWQELHQTGKSVPRRRQKRQWQSLAEDHRPGIGSTSEQSKPKTAWASTATTIATILLLHPVSNSKGQYPCQDLFSNHAIYYVISEWLGILHLLLIFLNWTL